MQGRLWELVRRCEKTTNEIGARRAYSPAADELVSLAVLALWTRVKTKKKRMKG